MVRSRERELSRTGITVPLPWQGGSQRIHFHACRRQSNSQTTNPRAQRILLANRFHFIERLERQFSNQIQSFFVDSKFRSSDLRNFYSIARISPNPKSPNQGVGNRSPKNQPICTPLPNTESVFGNQRPILETRNLLIFKSSYFPTISPACD